MPATDHSAQPVENHVDQILATHCTYGTSAFERETGERGKRVLGYSVRSSSISDVRMLKATYRLIEPYLSYDLPPDTPAGLKLQLTPEDAPRDLLYMPLPGGKKVVANVCHRQWDAVRQRPGAFFAHVLCWEDAGASSSFSALEAIQLWRATGWETEEKADTAHEIKSLVRTSDVLRGEQPNIDDTHLQRFLWDDAIPTLASFLPPRWLQMPAEARRNWFRLAFEGYLQLLDRPHESVVLITEPDAAVLLFYGIVRLAGPLFGQDISFSTYGISTQRVATKLKAITYWKPSQIPVEELRRNTRGVLLNTFVAVPPETLPAISSPPAGCAFLNTLLDTLQSGWPSVNHLQQTAGALLPRDSRAHQPSLKDIAFHLDKIAHGAQAVAAMFSADSEPPPPGWKEDPIQVRFVEAEVNRRLAEQGIAAARTVSSEFLPMALLLTMQRTSPEEDEVARALFDRLLGQVVPHQGLHFYNGISCLTIARGRCRYLPDESECEANLVAALPRRIRDLQQPFASAPGFPTEQAAVLRVLFCRVGYVDWGIDQGT